MPDIYIGRSDHYEGENVTTLARVVGGIDQFMLTTDTSGPLTIKITRRGAGTVYQKTLGVGATGIKDSPIDGTAYGVRGVLNFVYEYDADALAAESPPFEFQGGNTYVIFYDFDSPYYGHVIFRHDVRVLPAP